MNQLTQHLIETTPTRRKDDRWLPLVAMFLGAFLILAIFFAGVAVGIYIDKRATRDAEQSGWPREVPAALRH